MKHAFGAVVLAGLSAVPAMAQETAAADAADAAVIAERAAPAAPADPLRFDLGEGSIKIAIEAGAQVVAQSNAFWNLAEALAPTANFDPGMLPFEIGSLLVAAAPASEPAHG